MKQRGLLLALGRGAHGPLNVVQRLPRGVLLLLELDLLGRRLALEPLRLPLPEAFIASLAE